MNLSDEETKLILRQREVEDAHRRGWNKGVLRCVELLADWRDNGAHNAEQFELRLMNEVKQ